MDRRTIIAIVVVALIFIMLPYYWELIGYSKKPAPTSSTEHVEDSATAVDEQVNSLPTGPISDSILAVAPTELSRIDTLPEEFFQITTDLYEAKFSSKGGSLAEFRLNQFKYFRGDRIELVRHDAAYPLEFSFPDAGGLNSRQLVFSGDRKEIDLTSPSSDSVSLVLRATTASGAPVRLTYTFRHGSYLIGMRVDAPHTGELANASQLDIAWRRGLPPTEDHRKDDYGYFSGYVRQAGEVAKFDDFTDGRLRESSSGSIDWVGTKTKYFLVALIRREAPADEFEIIASEEKAVEGSENVARRTFDISLGSRLADSDWPQFDLYIGPVDYHVLTGLGYDLNKTVELGFWLFKPFAIAILWFLTAVHKVIPSYGLVIVAFTLVMKLILYPFSRKNYIQMAKMKALQPKLKALQEKHKDDPKRLNEQMMKFYKEEKFNPLGGCLWMLPQLPIFWALFTVFKAAIELRGASFLWLEDLSQADIALAVIMSAAMLVQQLLTNKDPKQKFMVYGFPVLMFFLFKGFPSGLVLYWTIYNILSIVEQKSVEATLPNEATPAIAR